MKDRIAQNPNRIGLTDENGVKKYYTLSREDNPTQEGTKLNKANLLSDDTSALLGLSDSATVNDFLNQVVGGGFKGFWWKKYTSKNDLVMSSASNGRASIGSFSASEHCNFYWADSVEDLGNGYAKLVDYSSYDYRGSYSSMTFLCGKYVCVEQNPDNLPISKLYYVTTDVTKAPYTQWSNNSETVYMDYIKYSGFAIQKDELNDYVCSSNLSTYPLNDCADDNYFYEIYKSVVVETIYCWQKYKQLECDKENKDYYNFYDNSSSTYTGSFTYSDFVVKDGEYFKLINPKEVSGSYSNYWERLRDVYQLIDASGYTTRNFYTCTNGAYERATNITFVPKGSKVQGINSTTFQYRFLNVVECTNIVSGMEELGAVSSINETEYPSGANLNGYYYGEKTTINLGGVKIERGKYNGTGVYGASNTNSLTLGFSPKCVIILEYYDGNPKFCVLLGNDGLIGVYGVSIYNGTNTCVYSKVENNTIYWYSNSVDMQMNTSGRTYNYIAIG